MVLMILKIKIWKKIILIYFQVKNIFFKIPCTIILNTNKKRKEEKGT
jgi:hypothetical protein